MSVFYNTLFWFFRKLEQNEESRKITKGDLDSGVKFITDEIKPDIDAMAVQIFSELPEENPFRLADAVPEQDLIHPPTEPVYQQLTLEDPSSEVREALEGNLGTSLVVVVFGALPE